MIQVNNIAKSFSGQKLFEGLSFNLPKGSRLGFVGRNGTGKSTLFKMILGEEPYDDGDITIPKNYRIGALKQHIKFTESSVKKECLMALPKEFEHETYRIDKVLSGLGFSKEDMTKDPASFSGGYQIRINLAKLLITEPHLLLLDEPTNYLDILSMRWLKSFLCSFPGEVMLITHDRNFMDQIVTHTMGLHRQKLKLIAGDTEKYYQQILVDEELYEKNRQSIDKKRKELEAFVNRFKAKASKASQAQSKQKQLNKLGQLKELVDETNLDFTFNYKDIASKNFLEVKDLSFGYTQENLFENIDLHLTKGDCLGIIGKNGKGKSTLLNCIAGELTTRTGEIKTHPNISLAHFGQTNIDRLSSNLTIAQEIQSMSEELSHTQTRQIAGAMMFPGELADKKVQVLSGGERSRVMLGKILARPSNLLLLDEPTNHLDMQSIQSLKDAIRHYPGATIIVTHSEELLRELANKLIIFRRDGAEFFLGNYDDFLEKIGWEDEEIKTQKQKLGLTKKEIQKLRSEIIQRRSQVLTPLKKEITQLETTVTKTESELTACQDQLIKASEVSDSEQITGLSKKISELEELIESNFESLVEKQNELDEHNEKFEVELAKIK